MVKNVATPLGEGILLGFLGGGVISGGGCLQGLCPRITKEPWIMQAAFSKENT